jgi:hypothetical protein
MHWRPSLPADEVTALDGLPITTPARTLLDLAATGLRSRHLEAAVDAAERRRLLDFTDLHELLARYPGRPGTPSLKAVLARYQPRRHTQRTRRDRAGALRRPRSTAAVGELRHRGKVRDFYWPHARLVVEACGRFRVSVG